MAVRLRYLAHDLEVPIGQFVIGRSPECQLSLDDPLVSRRHAILTVTEQGTMVEDLGSRNGVLVNGTRIEGTVALSNGDTVQIGAQQIVIGGVPDAGPSSPRHLDTRTRMPTLVGAVEAAAALAEAARPAMKSEELREDAYEDSTTFATSPLVQDAKRAPDRRVSSLALICGVAEKALALGHADEAERLLQRSLADVKARAHSATIDPSVAESAAHYATKLAGATGRGVWVDYIFETYGALGTLLPASVVDELYEVVRHVKIDRRALRAYTEMLRERSTEFGPGERFVLHRIEGLDRLGALK